jgi:predicted RecB family nuclease
MSGKITSDVLESYLKCRYKGYLKTMGEKGLSHDYEILMKESRERIRQAAMAKLLARHNGDKLLIRLPLTADLLKRGLPLLLDIGLEDEDLSVRFDALLRVDGDSRLGGFHYKPVIFHEAEKTSASLRMLLALHGVILCGIQGKEPATAVLFHGCGCQERKVKLAGVLAQARRRLREIRELRTDPLPRLVLNSHCQVCEFRQRCQAEATTKDDLSLLRGMGEKEIKKYARRGIFTVTQLSFTFRPPRKMKKPEERMVVHSHALQALSIREKKVHVLGSPLLPASANRIYLDLEGDPERGFCYLAGMVVRKGEAEERHSFWIDSPADEPILLGQLLSVAARNPDAWLYSYGGYEAAFLRRASKDAGRNEEVASILARLCNVLLIVHTHVYFPAYTNGLKDVARHLGFCWTDPDASGIQSVVWRRRWEDSGDMALKEKLATYNLEDCDALRHVAEFLYAACPRPSDEEQQPAVIGREVVRVDEMAPESTRREWCRADFVVGDFKFINKRAYFDYQRDKVYVRTSKTLKRSRSRNRGRKGKNNLPGNRHVELKVEKCPFCGSADLSWEPDGRLVRLAFDLQIIRGGIRRFVTRYTTSHHRCAVCQKRFLPWEYLRLDAHCHCLKSWAMYQHVVHRTSLANVAEIIKECFGLPVFDSDVDGFKVLLARYYEETYKRLLEKLVAGGHIHADETEIHLRGKIKGYVWVFTNLEEVVFMYKPSREGTFLHDLLKDFRGVLVSDFYAAYDSLDCPQQKCLIHLIRDFNQDIQGNPWDEELKSLAGGFGKLLRSVVATIDEHGLKRWHLIKHKLDVNRFFESVAKAQYRSELADGYCKRLLKCQGKLFTFIEHDGVPWNNNNAEHAIKRFAYYRELADGMLTEAGLNQYLVLLSICLTCKYKGVNFLKFLLSRQTDIDRFWLSPGRKMPPAGVELLPECYKGPNLRRRKQGWDQEIPAGARESVPGIRDGSLRPRASGQLGAGGEEDQK